MLSNAIPPLTKSYTTDQIKELKTCITELTEYMSRDIKFVPPSSTTDLCSAAKHFIISNHAVSIAEMESKHMVEIDQLKVGTSVIKGFVIFNSDLGFKDRQISLISDSNFPIEIDSR